MNTLKKWALASLAVATLGVAPARAGQDDCRPAPGSIRVAFERESNEFALLVRIRPVVGSLPAPWSLAMVGSAEACSNAAIGYALGGLETKIVPR
jgi:hypothetical protein